jgi:DNA-binding CsgD family transcriptional regulator
VLRDVGPPLAPADALAFLGHIDHAKGDRHSAGRRFEEVLRLSRAAGSVHLLALEGMARLAVEDANPDAARRLLEEALEHARRRSDKGGTARALYGLGDLARVQSGLRRAAALHGEALRLQHESGSAPGVVASLEAVAGVAVQAGRYKHAARLIGAAQARRERGGYARAPWQASRYEADLALVRRFLPAAELETELAEGAALPIEAVVVEAAASRRARRRHSSGWSSLTESERQVAVLVAEGMSNPQVAERLFVSRGTVKFHLANIFGKLGLGGRTQLAREVWRHQQAAPENDR